MKKIKAVLPLSAIFMAVGFSSVAVADVHYFVQLKVNDQQTELDIKTPKNETGGCSMLKRKGCIKANRGDQIKFSFLLAGNTSCNLATGANWKLTDVVLGGKGSSGKPASNGWGGLGGDTEVTSDFDFADASQGILRPLAGRTDRQVTFFDKNQYAYEIWYLVKADCVDTQGNVLKTITVDPRVVNEGKM